MKTAPKMNEVKSQDRETMEYVLQSVLENLQFEYTDASSLFGARFAIAYVEGEVEKLYPDCKKEDILNIFSEPLTFYKVRQRMEAKNKKSDLTAHQAYSETIHSISKQFSDLMDDLAGFWLQVGDRVCLRREVEVTGVVFQIDPNLIEAGNTTCLVSWDDCPEILDIQWTNKLELIQND